MNNPLPGFVLSVTGAFGVLALVAGFVPDVSGPEVRRPYTEGAVQSGATSAVTRPLSHIVWNVRGTLAESALSQLESAHSELEVMTVEETVESFKHLSPQVLGLKGDSLSTYEIYH